MYKVLVIGKGLFGSAAVRYLSQWSDRVAIIGPDEPADWSTHRGVFASHYDQGRIASAAGPDAIWNWLDRRSIAQYRPLERASGISFYNPVGLLRACLDGAPRRYPRDDPKSYRYVGLEASQVRTYTAADLRTEYQLQFPDRYELIFERDLAGYINPRDMIRAQLAMAERAGTTIIRETVTSVRDGVSHLAVVTAEGGTYQAEKVLLATGAFTNCFDLLARKLDLQVKSETIILGRVTPEEVERLARMPAVSYEVDSPVLEGIYLLPPIRYPDGHHYVKMGCNTASDQLLPDLEAMRAWCIAGDSNVHLEALREAVLSIIPDLKVTHWETKRCLVTYTPQRKPFIDEIVPGRVYVAVAGNGTGAHPSDAIGQVAAAFMLQGNWPAALERELFRARYASGAF